MYLIFRKDQDTLDHISGKRIKCPNPQSSKELEISTSSDVLCFEYLYYLQR